MRSEVHALSGAYALDAVGDPERAAFDRHLARCERCAREVAGLLAAAASLPELVAAVPPAGIRIAVLSQIRWTRQAGSCRRGSARGRAPWRWRVAVAGAAVAVVAAGVAGGAYAVQESRVRQARAQAAQADRIAAVLSAPDGRRYGGRLGREGHVRLTVSGSSGQGVAVLLGVRDPGSGYSYQVWMMRGTGAVNAGAVLTSGAGTVLLADMRGVDNVAVSLEARRAVARSPAVVLVRIPVR